MKIPSKAVCGTVYVLLAAVLWSTIGLYVRTLSPVLGIWETALTRMGVGLAAMAVYLFLFHRDRLFIRLKDVWIFAGGGILSLMCMNYCYSEAVQRTSLAIAGTLLYTAPAFVMLMSVAFFREVMTGRKLLSLVLAFGGCALVSGIARGQLSLTPEALLLGLGSGVSYALYSIFSRAALDRGYDSWTITFYSFVFCTLGCALCAKPMRIAAALTLSPPLLLPMLLLGLTTGFAAYLLYTRGLTCFAPGRASILASFELVSGAVIGVIVFRERIGFDGVCGIALLLAAVAVLSLPGKK